ncbi:FecR family protein [Roseiarcus fermentans]|uniref:FecR family protein n=1 Tax=Roseiarcus fermentans TaxID=1473586 RepID=UPI001474E0B5|nr:FecR domain-containing protein [Roseiarcus fermentans]
MIVVCGAGHARAQQNIGSAAASLNVVTRELSGAAAPLKAGDDVFRNEIVRTGEDSRAKLVFLDSTNLAIGPTSRVTLDEFVYSTEVSAQKVTVNLAKGVFRFTTGALDKKAYQINTPTASVGVRGTVLDIDARSAQTRVTLVEGQALVCPRRAGVTFESQVSDCASGRRCDCVQLNQDGQTAQVRRGAGGAVQAGLVAAPVNIGALCSGSLCSPVAFASAGPIGAGGGTLGAGGFPAGALCGH